eukprot:468065-Pleurochrysis_carterae.AAC.2
MLRGKLPREKRRLVRASDVRAILLYPRNSSVHSCHNKIFCTVSHDVLTNESNECNCRQGGSESVNFSVHAFHATLVHRRISDEIVWARPPPDHSHEEIHRLFSTIEEILSSPSCP